MSAISEAMSTLSTVFFFNLQLFWNSEGKLQAVDYTKMGAYTNQLLQSVEPMVNCIVAIQNEIQFK